ncbi:MAG: hypothetical protein KGL52_03985 [Rhodospirillales bacterium]|nr:hypothetical protein [Rhodospirillales bacterium]
MRIETAAASYRRAVLSLSGWTLYLGWVIGTAVALLSLYLVSLVGLAQVKLLPPPPIINNLCADAKLKFYRDHLLEAPTLITVGSSVAWRDVDSAELQGNGQVPLNAGFCAAQVNQAAFVARFFMDQFPTVDTVLAVLAPQDLRGCSQTRTRLFDRRDAEAYMFRRTWVYGLYLRYFDPVSLARNVRRLSRHLRDLDMDQWGDGLLVRTTARPVIYTAFGHYDPTCFTALHDLAVSVRARGARLMVVAAPINSEWTRRFDPDHRIVRALATRTEAALKETGAIFWNARKDFPTRPSDFTDNALHLERGTAARFTAALARVLDRGARS